MPVLPPLPADQWDDKVIGALSGMLPRKMRNPEDAGNALATLVHHPDLTAAFLRFNVHVLFRSTLSPRLREMTILRVARLHDSPYESSHHLPLAAEAGLSEEEIAAAQRGEAADEFERKVLEAVDESHKTSRLSESTWTALGEHLDVQQRMDFLFTIGAYGLMALAFNTFGVELENER